LADHEMKDLCGIKTDLTGSKPMVGDGAALLELTKLLVKKPRPGELGATGLPLLRRHPGVDPALEHRERLGAFTNHQVVEGLDVEPGP
jgi:hypothetical protein